MDKCVTAITNAFINAHVIDEKEFDLYYYCFDLIISKILFFSVIFMIAILSGNMAITIAYYIGFLAIRYNTGGYHASTPTKCFFISILIYLLNLQIINLISASITLPFIIILFVLHSLIIYYFAPIDHANRPFSDQEKNKFKKSSRFAIVLMLIIVLLTFAFSIKLAWAITCGVSFATISLLIAYLKRKEELSYDEEITL